MLDVPLKEGQLEVSMLQLSAQTLQGGISFFYRGRLK